jgi:hypothetical protein
MDITMRQVSAIQIIPLFIQASFNIWRLLENWLNTHFRMRKSLLIRSFPALIGKTCVNYNYSSFASCLFIVPVNQYPVDAYHTVLHMLFDMDIHKN